MPMKKRNGVSREIEEYAAARRRKKRWLAAVTCLAAAVVFGTAYALILPAITWEKDQVLDCSYEAHQHEDSCFDEEGNVICGYADYAVHAHDESYCYDADGHLVCELEEIEEHVHDASCYEEQTVLICGQEESEGHVHDESCYTLVQGQLICENTEEGHAHTDDCYEWTVELACGQEEGDGGHQHTDECCETQAILACGLDEVILHTHTDECYEDILDENGEVIGRTLACGLLQVEEHTHTDNCLVYSEESAVANGENDSYVEDADEASGPDMPGTEDAMDGSDMPDAQSMTDEPDAQDVQYVPVTGGFFLWLKLFDKNGDIQDIYSDPVWANGAFQSNGITDALTYTENNETWYLIPVSYFIQYYGSYGYQFDADAACPFQYAPDAFDSAGGLTTASYVYAGSGENAGETTDDEETSGWYVRVQDKGSYSNPDNPRSNIYYTVPAKVVTGTVSPSGTVINLFDYWATEKIERDVTENYYDSGINEDHALKFKATGLSGANTWTGNAEVYPGIVADTLGEDGYPHLSGQGIFGNAAGQLASSDESLAYLFDPTYTGPSGSYRDAYRNVTGLLQVDEDGYYYYNSTKNYAEFDSTKNGFTLYDQWSLTYTSDNLNTINGQFFPFDPYSTVSKTITAGSDDLNHFFGMTLTTRFVQQYDGHTNSSRTKETTFEFSGDDDVWIFIDGVLVADLGGIHDPSSVTINFANGEIVINEGQDYEKKTTLYDVFQAAGAEDLVEWSADEDGNGHSDTFANNTYHTLRFYYLERGSYASNLSLRYNLSSYPPTGINKVNQYGDVVAGAAFSVYPATVGPDGTWTYNESAAAYTGVTDADGEMVFVDEDKMPYTMAELENMFGEYFILKETKAPDGYRLVSEEIRLHIKNGVMVCENTYESGVWADATLQVTAPNAVKLVNGDVKEVMTGDFDNFTENGKIFAVVLKYIGDPLDNSDSIDALSKQANWAPVYGTSEAGFTIVDVSRDFSGNFTSAVIDTAKRYKESDNVFSMSAGSGALMGTMNGMPGDLTTYYYMLPAGEKDKTQYTVAYYWTAADSLEEATADNTWRIDVDAIGYAFDRVFGSTINVPNLINRLFVQKLDEDGTLMDGAKFAMYSVKEVKGEETGDSAIYYCADDADGTLIDLSSDTDGDNGGTAIIVKDNTAGGSTADGTYQVDGGTGVITVTLTDDSSSTVYTISPEPYAMEGGGVAVTVPASSSNNPTVEDGTATFTNMDPGTYYVREIAAPAGYAINPAEVMVLVDESAVYANAGTADDGVDVGRGTGYLVSSLDQFASQGDIDNTLTWIFEMMRVSPVSTSFADSDFVHSEAYQSWGYLAKNYDGENLTEETTQHTADGALRTYLAYSPDAANQLFNYVVNTQRESGGNTRRLYTNVGWSYYELYQDWRWALGYESESIDRHKSENAAYTVLTNDGTTDGSLLEIANLFSRATYIRVTDARVTGDLEISKTVKNPGNAPEKDSGEFLFTVTLKDAKDNALTGSYPYTVYDVDTDGERTKAKDEDGNTITGYIGTITVEDDTGGSTVESNDTITLTDHQVAVIENLPAGTRYVITEKGSGEFITTVEEKVLDVPKNSDDESPGESKNGVEADESGDGEEISDSWKWNKYSFGMDETERTVEGTLYWHMDEDGSVDAHSVVNYTNTYLPDLTIWKVDASDPTVPLEGAGFVFYKTVTAEAEDGGEESTAIRYYYDKGNWVTLAENVDGEDAVAGQDGEDAITDQDGEHAITDQDGEHAVTLELVTQTTSKDGKITYANIPDGTYYLEEVEAPDGYSPLAGAIAITVSDGEITAATMGGQPYSAGPETGTWLTLTVPNYFTYILPNTGGAGTNLFTIGGLLLMAGAAGCGYELRRRRERRVK